MYFFWLLIATAAIPPQTTKHFRVDALPRRLGDKDERLVRVVPMTPHEREKMKWSRDGIVTPIRLENVEDLNEAIRQKFGSDRILSRHRREVDNGQDAYSNLVRDVFPVTIIIIIILTGLILALSIVCCKKVNPRGDYCGDDTSVQEEEQQAQQEFSAVHHNKKTLVGEAVVYRPVSTNTGF